MANEQLKRLFRRAPEMDEAEFDLLQSRVQARLRASGAERDRAAAEDAANGDGNGSVAIGVAGAGTTDAEPGEPAEAEARLDAPAGRARYMAIRATTYELPEDAVGVMADTNGSDWERPASDAVLDEIADRVSSASPEPVVPLVDDVETEVAQAPTVKVARTKAVATKPSTAERRGRKPPTATAPRSKPPIATTSRTKPPTAAAGPARPPRRLPARPPAPVVRSAGLPYCPYCATLLDPPPEVNRRCPRCRERIIVKHVDGRAVYLTEASVAVFEAERRRLMNAGRWNRERQRWLRAAATVDAPADRIRRLESAPISDAAVEASRALYVATVERAFRIAKRERRWEDASRTMREHALILFRIAGSPVPPPEEILKPHRDAAAAALRGLGGMAREAELLGGRCCDACLQDDGRTFPISAELRTPRLPHAGCPKGLCRCDWYLAIRDESLVRRHLRRRKRAEVAQPADSA